MKRLDIGILWLVLLSSCTTSSQEEPIPLKSSEKGWSSIKAGQTHTCGIDVRGEIQCWGQSGFESHENPIEPPLGRFVAIDSGNAFSCALSEGGSTSCWGDSSFGKASPPTEPLSLLSLGYEHACALDTNGEIVCWGIDDQALFETPTGNY